MTRPRVEGERVEQIRARAELVVAVGGEEFASMATAINQSGSTPTLPYVSVLDVRDLAADWQRLTAEVERLTEEKAEAVAIATEAVEMIGSTPNTKPITDSRVAMYIALRNRLRAALSLPTPAPEATNDGK